MARAFAGAGMHVVIADIELEAAQAVAQELNGTPIQLDVARPDEVAAVADRIYRDHGAVHLLCNNAGAAIGGHLSAMPHDAWRWITPVNIEGVTNGLPAFLPRINAKAGDTHIHNTASRASPSPLPRRGASPPQQQT